GFDPHFTSFDGETYSTLEDYLGLDLILVTHGHFEHWADVPAIASASQVRVATSAELGATMVDGGLDRARLIVLEEGQPVRFGDVEVTPHIWVHRTMMDRWPLLLASRPDAPDKMRGPIRQSTEAPLLGFRLEIPQVGPLTWVGEAFHNQTRPELVAHLRSQGDPGPTFVSLEPELEDFAAQAVGWFRPGAVVAFSAHTPLWDYFGLPRVCPERFAGQVSGCPVRYLEPGDSFLL
ncbi:MAG: MBL fold metallo-hydrolase, partial [Candidatus Eremiobacterota bacterium]